MQALKSITVSFFLAQAYLGAASPFPSAVIRAQPLADFQSLSLSSLPLHHDVYTRAAIYEDALKRAATETEGGRGGYSRKRTDTVTGSDGSSDDTDFGRGGYNKVLTDMVARSKPIVGDEELSSDADLGRGGYNKRETDLASDSDFDCGGLDHKRRCMPVISTAIY